MSRGRPKPEKVERIRVALLARDGGSCFYCRKPFTDETPATFDHYIPRAIWRTWRQRNLVLACEPCNHAKGDLLPWPVAALLLRNVRHSDVWQRACGLAA
ncbi:HNH endonuclease [Streptomyces sp. SP18ES09]|uniref:HNH endonuclease n=1 Tax=Streptomyces sp. SP18ES09 TaxID=3002532 RepID=UPI002E793ED9|nr:HNH endonuclease [Streptomyces sp. SP18ES09]MEE1818481.1 HNH endonuclease [Streptomyces sp. SP18ES09]